DLAAADLDERLVAEADAEGRCRRQEALDDRARRSGRGRAAGTGGDDEMRRREPLGFVRVDLVVAAHDDLRSLRAEQVREVPRERVVVVDEQDHCCWLEPSPAEPVTPGRESWWDSASST